jgi:hypothetical protein|tara:strand:+ start:2719 stop:2997 length:279 start_codon:yes stop_codon:yes gene_type:complete
MKHRTDWGDIDTAAYAMKIGEMKTHQERMDYMKGLSPGCINLCYLLAMQMSLPKTIARLKTREERRRAWEELPDNSMKDMVKQRVIKIYKER